MMSHHGNGEDYCPRLPSPTSILELLICQHSLVGVPIIFSYLEWCLNYFLRISAEHHVILVQLLYLCSCILCSVESLVA